MKHIGETLDSLMRSNRIVKRSVADKVGMAYSHFVQLKHRSSIDADLLDRICKAIDVSPGYFFDDWPDSSRLHHPAENAHQPVQNTAEYLKNEVELLKMIIAEKERTISLLEKCVENQQQTTPDDSRTISNK